MTLPGLNRAEWEVTRRTNRLAAFREQRPKMLRHAGELDPVIAGWGRRLVDGTAGNLIIVGPTGVGKTWSVWEVLERAVEAGYTGRIMVVTAAQWLDAITRPVDRELLRQWREADVLVLDDLGTIRVDEWQQEQLAPVVDERWQHARPTVITTNLPKLRKTLGERIASRLAHEATVVALNGPDRRAGQREVTAQ